MHNGFVTINEEKMSKSLGNFVTINKLLEQYDSNTIRFFILTNHYRMPVGFNDESLTAAQNGVKRIKNAIDEAGNFIGEKVEPQTNPENASVKAFIDAMDNDFNTAKAIAVLFDLTSNINKAKEANDKSLAKENLQILLGISNVLGFDFTVEKEVDYFEIKQKLLTFIKSDEIISKSFLGETMLAGAENIPTEDKEMFEYALKLVITSRNKAREEKQWAYSDQIRDGLLAVGIVLKDTKEGTSWIIE
jgi:cysteinyl-tRNA synthetase